MQDCPQHEYLDKTRSITSFAVGKDYAIRFALDCRAVNVVYVVSCAKYKVQGVGECYSALTRFQSYIRTVTVPGLVPGNFSCAIHRHFVETPHEKKDLRFCIVDALPLKVCAKPAVIPALRKKLENRWIH